MNLQSPILTLKEEVHNMENHVKILSEASTPQPCLLKEIVMYKQKIKEHKKALEHLIPLHQTT